ncbi:glycosyl transferase [Coraliomargarita sinensis]|uniref:Glycosyl transferase n=1 Tax=Coraliomargarita sinensis TaxID=2174842 RepID=A0A317ZH82_9BACT|nr:glycosyltransferase family 2 protein [Coraliomargarita sinensis]PXA03667.1 glycosyl transferase [Coraliomargarita sinensis]
MLISVITVSYNSAATIADTVASVVGQAGVNVEYIVVDGASTDATLEKLQPYRDEIDILVSEPDRGMYDAMNKGIARASGEVVAILNSDDVYADNRVLARVAEQFYQSGTDCVYGDLNYVSSDLSRVVRDWQSGGYRPGQFRRGWHPPHPAFFVRRSVYRELGGFQLNLPIAADYEFMLRVLQTHGRSVAYLPEVLVKMRTGGASNRSALNILKANWQCYQAWRMNGYSPLAGACAVARKPVSKLKQLRRRAQC